MISAFRLASALIQLGAFGFAKEILSFRRNPADQTRLKEIRKIGKTGRRD